MVVAAASPLLVEVPALGAGQQRSKACLAMYSR